MKIMIIDNDEVTAQLTASKLQALYHEVVVEFDKDRASQRGVSEDIDVFLINPSPANSARSFILNLRRSVNGYPYVFEFGSELTLENAIKAGANDVFLKPIDPSVIGDKLDNAEALIKLVNRIGDDSEDFPSAGGVIAKSAFNQLFLSALDRADRYGD